MHATGHSLDELGLLPSRDSGEPKPLSFDGRDGLAARLRSASTPLGRSFTLQQTKFTLDSAMQADAGERLLIFCYHGHADDIRVLHEAQEAALSRSDPVPLEHLKGQHGIELVGHYVVVDTNLGIIYTEPEVHVVTQEQRLNPSLLHELLSEPPFQLVFDRTATAMRRTRLLSLHVTRHGATRSNYAHRTALPQAWKERSQSR